VVQSRHGQLTEDYFKTWIAYMATVPQRPAFRAMGFQPNDSMQTVASTRHVYLSALCASIH
jgi:hypothetical protein